MSQYESLAYLEKWMTKLRSASQSSIFQNSALYNNLQTLQTLVKADLLKTPGSINEVTQVKRKGTSMF